MYYINNELLMLVFNNLYCGVYITDCKGTSLCVNKPFEEMSGISSDEIVGKTMQELVEKKYFSASASLLVLESKKPAAATYNTKTNKKLLARGKPIFNKNGNIEYVINTVFDLTVVDYKDRIDRDGVRESYLNEENFITYSNEMLEIVDLLLKIASMDTTVLITGESGVGKGVIASMLHKASNRKNQAFIKINCAAIPETLFESELFGYEDGAFTGAKKSGKYGLFELANKGIIFLDEISEIPLHVQAKLLNVIEDKSFLKIGGQKFTNVDVKIVAATNKNLLQLVDEGKFREDLYYRLNVIHINIPPLRERKDDIKPLITYFINKYNEKYNCFKKISKSLMSILEESPWYGNVRELENTIERLIITSKGDLITESDLSLRSGSDNYTIKIKLEDILSNYEKEILYKAKNTYKSTREIAKVFGVSQATVVRKLKKYKINNL